MSTDTAVTLARIYLQTLGLSLLFVGAGEFVHRRLNGRHRPAGVPGPDAFALRWSSAYFLGLSAFLLAFVVLARVVGAERALWVVLTLMAGATLVELAAVPGRLAVRRVLTAAIVLVSLVGIYSVTNLALWLDWRSAEPTLMAHFGSIHSGRYANYAMFIAQQNVVPYLDQNGGQSLLASVHLLLGVDSPLAAVMVWVPFSLAFLTILVFGLFRSASFSVASCMAATWLVMVCNVAVSFTHVFVFDNGSPVAFIGYTDMIIAIATFILLCRWFQAELLMENHGPHTRLLLPGLLGITWCWYAPQNVVIWPTSCAAAALVWKWRDPSFGLLRRFGGLLLVFALSVGFGATQFGTFLPDSLKENTGLWSQEVGSMVAIRPYAQYLTSHWTAPRWNLHPPPPANLVTNVYEETYAAARAVGRDQVYRSVTWLVEEHLWDSIRAYGFPLVGLVLLGMSLRRLAWMPGGLRRAWQAWLLLSVFAFGFGYAISFGLEIDRMKWWLTRFLVPGSVMALICLAVAVLVRLGGAKSATRRVSWCLVLLGATWGPLTEVATVGAMNFVMAGKENRIGRRLNALVQAKGLFLFDSLFVHTDAATRDLTAYQSYIVGGEGYRPGPALYSYALHLRAGGYRAGYRVRLAAPIAPERAVMDLEVTTGDGRIVVARRSVRASDLEWRDDGYWAWLDFDLLDHAKDAQFRLASTSDVRFNVDDLRLVRR